MKQTKHSMFDAEIFRQEGHKTIDMLADYLGSMGDSMPVLPAVPPDALLAQWDGDFPEEGKGVAVLQSILAQTLKDSLHMHHPRCMGHQVSAPLPLSALCDLIGSLLNNGATVYEVGQVTTVLEKHVINWAAELLGFGAMSDGIFTSGGSLGNLTALLTARQVKGGNVWKEGYGGDKRLSVLVSAQAHYSVKRATQIMGLGEGGAISVPVDDRYRMDMDALKAAYEQAEKGGRKVFAVVASACCTATGSYDPLEPIADFCKVHNLWMHVDGAHGVVAALSDKHRHLVKGIERADSVIWDFHKMMLVPALITAVIYKRKGDSYAPFAQEASYLYEKNAQEEWYNLGHRTFECTKTMAVLKAYTCLMAYGTGMFTQYIEGVFALTRRFAEMIREAGDFTLAIEPACNIICFRYTPGHVPESLLDSLQSSIRRKLLESGKFYIVQTRLGGRVHLRCTIINPLTEEVDLAALLETIRATKVDMEDASPNEYWSEQVSTQQ